MIKDKSLPKARQEWVLREIRGLKLSNPVAELSAALGYGKSLISEVLNRKAAVSLNFFKTFCEKFGYNSDEINHLLIDEIKAAIQNNSEINNSQKAQNKEHKSEVLTDNNDIPSNSKIEEVEDMTTTLMLMHKETIEVMRSLSRSFEDVAKANLIQAQMLRQRFGIDENESEEQSFKKAV